MKPNWDDAPEWAMFLAMDRSGTWCWFQTRPIGKDGVWTYNEFQTTGHMALAGRTPLPDYLSTLEARP